MLRALPLLALAFALVLPGTARGEASSEGEGDAGEDEERGAADEVEALLDEATRLFADEADFGAALEALRLGVDALPEPAANRVSAAG